MARIGTAFVEISGDFGPLRRQLAEMQRGRGIKLDVELTGAAKVAAEKDKLARDKTVEFKADLDTSSWTKARQGMAVLTKESNKLGDVFNRSNLSIGQWTGILSAASPVILDAAGALGALTASLAAATAGVAALGVGFASAGAVGFGGIAAIAIPAVKSLKDLMTAQTAADKARATGAQGAARSQAAAAQQIKTATEAVTTAENNLKVAQETEATAQKALTQARLDAVRQLEDMRRAAIEGGTSEKRARLSIQQAEANLRQVRASSSSSVLDIKDAELSVTEARQNAKDVAIQANRAQQDYNKAQKKGIDQMPGVVSAQQSLTSATRGVATAQNDVAKATQNLAFQQKQANTATQAGGTSMAALALAQKKAGPAAVKFAASLKALSRRWKELTAAGKADFFGALNDGLNVLDKRLPLFAKSANESMAAARGAFDKFLGRLTAGPGFTKFINVMTKTFADSIGPIAVAFGNIGKVLERIAVAVAPDVLRMAKGFRDITQGWVDSTRNASDLQDVIHGLVNQTVTWLKLIKAAAQLIIAVLVPGMGQGKKAVEGITASLQEWTRWVQQHPKEMRDFFKEALKTTGELVQVLLGFIPTLFQISTAMRPIARGFLAILKGLNSLKIGNVTALTVLLGGLVGAKIASGLAGVVKSVQSLAVAWGAVRTAAAGAAVAQTAASVPVPQMGLASGRQMGLASAPRVAPGIVASTGGLANFAKVAGGAALAITALVGAVEALRTNFLGVRGVFTGFFDKVLKPLNDAFTELLNTVSGGHAGEVFGAFAQAFRVMAKPLAFVVRNLTKFIGLLAIGGISAAFITAIVAIVGPLYVAIKAITLMVKGLKELGKVAKNVSEVLVTVFTEAFAKIKDIFRSGTGVALGAFKRFAGGIHDVIDGIAHVFRGLYLVIKKIAEWIGNQVNKVGNALGGLKDKIPDLGIHLSVPSIPNPFNGQKGMMVVPGKGTGDSVPVRAMVEPGEVLAVMNRNAAKKWMAWNQAFPRFQGGGFTGMQPGIVRLAKTMLSRFGGHMSSGLRPGDPGFHGRGLAADIVPANWRGATTYANQVGPQLLEGIHQAPPGVNVSWDSGSKVSPGFWGASTWAQHISHIHLAIGKAIKGALGAAASQIGKIKVKGRGPGADIAQAAADRMRKQANAFLSKIAPTTVSTDTGLIHGDGNVERVFASVARKLSASRTATLALGEAGFAESGMRDLSFGDASSQGALQLLSSTAAGLGISPHDEGAIASAFFLRGFAGKGGANALAAQGLSAQMVAQGVQGSAFASGSNYAAQRGAAKAWMRRFGLQLGGVVGPYVGKFHDGGFVGQDGLGWLQRGETVLPQLQKGGTANRLDWEVRQVRHEERVAARRLEKERAKDHPDKGVIRHLKKLTERLQTHEAVLHELMKEQKEIHRDSKERNRLLREIRANEKGGMRAVSNFIASDIGYRQRQKTRQASAGSVARY